MLGDLNLQCNYYKFSKNAVKSLVHFLILIIDMPKWRSCLLTVVSTLRNYARENQLNLTEQLAGACEYIKSADQNG